MGLLSWIIVGIAIGVLALRYLPHRPGGRSATLILTTIGALVGGYISIYFSYGALSDFDFTSLFIALTCALIMVVLIRLMRI